MAGVDQNSNTVLQGIARHINCLGEQNRNVKKKALEDIRKETLNRTPRLEVDDLQCVFNEIVKPLLKVLSDTVEKCRELAIVLILDFLKSLPNPDEYLSYVIPVLVQRLGQQEIVEPSEEIRLILIQLFSLLIQKSGKKLSVYLDDCIKILQRTIVDPYPEVKKESCICASNLSKAIPEYFHMQSESLIKPLLVTISHQHAKVRTIVVETIGNVIQHGNGKSVDTVTSHLAQRMFDQSPIVRTAVTKVVGGWLLDLADRYSFHHKLIPLLLSGIIDEQPQIRELGETLWHDVGLKYESENEDDLKDKSDFAKPPPSHYPPSIDRPNLGCRTLIMRNLSRILPALVRDLGDWVAPTRVKSSALLYVLILNAEDYTTQHMQLLLNGMYKACCDEETQAVKDIQRSAELIGYFVEPAVWCKMILPNVRSSQSLGPLMVLACVIRGSERKSLKSYLTQITETILFPDVCHSFQTPMQDQLLACVESVITTSKEDVADISQSIFHLLLTVSALAQAEATKMKVQSLLTKLCQVLNFQSLEEIFRSCSRPLIESFRESYATWNVHSVERLVFDSLIMAAGPVVGEHLDDIIPILVCNLNPEKDAEVRLKFFSLLSHLMMNAANTLDSHGKFGDFAVTIVKDMILPNCVWKAGRTAGAIRTTAVSCMWAVLQCGVLTKDKLEPVVEDVITQILVSMDDDNKSTRLVSCRVLTRLFDLMGGALDQDRLHNMYPELLKRLDDSSDEIRIMVSKTFLAYLDCFEDKYDTNLYRAHLEAMYRGLLVHLDDPETKIQEAILDVLKKAAELKPSLLMNELEQVRHKHRTSRYCEDLLSYSQKLTNL
ncbi:hypothetical protein ScPMuIL_004982 [Solemya velum]